MLYQTIGCCCRAQATLGFGVVVNCIAQWMLAYLVEGRIIVTAICGKQEVDRDCSQVVLAVCAGRFVMIRPHFRAK